MHGGTVGEYRYYRANAATDISARGWNVRIPVKERDPTTANDDVALFGLISFFFFPNCANF